MVNEKTNELVIVREINAPRELVFNAFTKAEHLAHWWGPKGMKIEIIQLSVKPGGRFHYSMEANGQKMWGVFEYLEVEPYSKVVFTNSFADEKGNAIRAPFSPDFPLKIKNTWLFEESNGKTTLVLRGIPVDATEAENNFFKAMHANMQQGFAGTFDQLIDYIETVK